MLSPDRAAVAGNLRFMLCPHHVESSRSGLPRQILPESDICACTGADDQCPKVQIRTSAVEAIRLLRRMTSLAESGQLVWLGLFSTEAL